MEADRSGLALSTASADAAVHYREGVECLLRGRPGAGDSFALATEVDPLFCEAHVGRAFSALYDGDVANAGHFLVDAGRCAVTERARGHVAVVRALSQFDVAAMTSLGRPHLAEFPGDDLAREAVGLLNFLLGRSDVIIDLYDWLSPGRADDWAFAASWSFACHEVGRLDESRQLGELALGERPDHAFAAHSLAHVAFESGSHEDGAGFLRTFLGAHRPIAFQHRHLRWHLALHLLALGREDEARELWGVALAPEAVPTTLGVMEDGVGLLWRWHLYGLEGWELPWAELAESAGQIALLPVVPLPAACAAVALAALGHRSELATLLSTADSMADAGMPVPASVLHAVASGAEATFAGAWGDAAAALLPARGQFIALGGSRAQREVFDDALLLSLIRSGRGAEAVPLLEARLARRPSDRERRLLGGLAS
jgi:hypothetical protein